MKQALVVDDSPVIRKIARQMLERMDFQVREAEDGAAAAKNCAAAMPDMILLDWHMPVMSGFEFLKQLRGMPEGDKPKVVFCTTENSVDMIQRAMSAGADEYIMKPFDEFIVREKLIQIGLVDA
jgi:two-component system, chemotaxis family, chemotaxis protein CheY